MHDVEVELELLLKTEDGEIVKETIAPELKVCCDIHCEYCHGWHTWFVPDDNDLERAINEYLENLTPEDLQKQFNFEYKIKEIIC